MKQASTFRQQILPYLLVIIAFISYMVIYVDYYNQAGAGITSFATIPVIVAGWYFSVGGGLSMAGLSILIGIVLQASQSHSAFIVLSNLNNILRMISLMLTAVVTGSLSAVMRKYQETTQRLQKYENERQAYTKFLELLNKITAKALEADGFQATIEILTEQITGLFKADDGFFSFWDAAKETPLPSVAYGSMKDIYPYIIFEPKDQTLTTSVLKVERPIAISNIENSPYISPKVAGLFPSRSMLGIPLIAQGRKHGALLLGYNQQREFDDNEILQANLTADQVALLLSKALLLEEERKQVKQLTALHDVATASIQTDNEDQLIEHVTDLIGQNLFPNNFGIMLFDERDQLLHIHPSYRFYNNDAIKMKELKLGEGITGYVAKTGIPQCIGNVNRDRNYVGVDNRTISELCVPIKFKERILGVINAESTKRDAFTIDDERLLTTLAGQLATAIEQLRKSQAERTWLEQLAHSNELIYDIAQITTQIEKAFTVEEIIQTIGHELRKIDLTCIMAIHDSQRGQFTVNFTSLPEEFLNIVEKGLGYPLLEYTFSNNQLGQALKSEDWLRPAMIPNPEDEIGYLFTNTERPGVLRILGEIGVIDGIEPLRMPLVFEENLLGILWVWGSGIRNTDLPIMSIFAKQIGASLERARLFQEVQSLALTDPLTGLHNRRGIFELSRVEFARAQRLDRPICCMMLDLDHFKQINDDYGHQAGDQILQEFANRCKCSVREMDLVGRYGGEELIILMPEIDLATALNVAERLRMTVANTPVKLSNCDANMTVSIGLAQRDEHTLHLETLIARADQAMYIAKHKGRNRVATSK